MSHLTIGVEEEFHLADPVTRKTSGTSDQVMDEVRSGSVLAGQLETELHLSMIETCTTICDSLGEVRTELGRLRGDLVDTAERAGQLLASAGTLPVLGTSSPDVVRNERYVQIESLHGGIVGEMSTCGTHVHVAVPDRAAGVQVMNRVRRWLPALLALSAGSPFWDGRDTGFASYRTVLWGRWPSATMPEPFDDVAQYDAVIEAMIESGAILDVGQVYWDVRLSADHPTIEFRVADAALTLDDAVLQAGLCRALVQTALVETEAGDPVPSYRPELLRAAKWRAARYGISDNLLDLDARTQVPAATELESLVRHVTPALEDTGDLVAVQELTDTVLSRGDSASLQRAVHAERRRWTDVVDMVAARTRGI